MPIARRTIVSPSPSGRGNPAPTSHVPRNPLLLCFSASTSFSTRDRLFHHFIKKGPGPFLYVPLCEGVTKTPVRMTKFLCFSASLLLCFSASSFSLLFSIFHLLYSYSATPGPSRSRRAKQRPARKQESPTRHGQNPPRIGAPRSPRPKKEK